MQSKFFNLVFKIASDYDWANVISIPFTGKSLYLKWEKVLVVRFDLVRSVQKVYNLHIYQLDSVYLDSDLAKDKDNTFDVF